MASAPCSAMPSLRRSSSGVKWWVASDHSTVKPPTTSSFQWIGCTRIERWGNNRASGSLFQIQIQNNQVVVHEDAQRGLWYQTPYSTFAWRTIAETSNGFAADLTVEEMDFLRAEAYIRLNRAADLVGASRRFLVSHPSHPTLTGRQASTSLPALLELLQA